MKTNRLHSNSTIVHLDYHLLISIFSSLIFLALSFSPAQAQTISLSIWPPLVEVNLQPGQAYTQIYQLKNLGDNTTITASLIPFKPVNDSGHIQLTPNAVTLPLNYFSLQNNDISFNQPFPLPAGKSVDIILKINPPQSAPDADFYLTLLFQADSPGLFKGSGSKNLAAIGTNILFSLAQNPIPLKANIDQFSLNSPLTLLDSFQPITFNLRLKNSGPTRLKAIGHLQITNPFGQTTTLPLKEDNVLAGTARKLTTTSSFKPRLPFGRYTATAHITPENSTTKLTQTITFWILPYKLLLIIVLAILVKIALSKYIRKGRI